MLPKRLAAGRSLNASGLPFEAAESAIQSCDIFPIGSFRKDHASVPPKRGTERRKSLKVPLLRHVYQDQQVSNTPASPAPQKYAPKYFRATFPPALCKSSELMMLPPTIDSTASTWFQIWVAALSPIALVSFVFHAAGFVDIDDCRFNPVSQPSPNLGEVDCA
jgi:hypothetical protein